MQKWVVINKKADFQQIGKKFQIDQVTARILRNRDLVEDEDIHLFLNGKKEDLYNPHLLKDGDLLADILLKKIREKKKIRIIGDYDIDGVMSSYILYKSLLYLQASVDVLIPDRIADGYGLNEKLIYDAKEAGIDTILTCDNGIAALDEIALAKSFGMTVLVTDHHAIPFEEKDGLRVEKVSKADAVVNPHQRACKYPFKELCGAAVAWKVMGIVFEKWGAGQELWDEFMENVAFATVGDIMSLTGENRILVKEGLKNIHHTKNVGMKALIGQSGLECKQLDSYHFGYVLGPCINASGRLETAQRALELLMETEESKAASMAQELVVLNNERKAMTINGVEEAKKVYEEEQMDKDKVIVLYLPSVHESIAGIIAGRVRELYYKPTIVLTNGKEGVKGSGRSTENYHMYEELCKCQELFTKFGGHKMAAGLSLPRENVELFREKINALCTLSEEEQMEKIRIDVPMPMDYVTMDLVRELSILAPFGKDNERPVFADRGIRIQRMWIIGKKKNVLRLSLITSGGQVVSGIYFGDLEEFLAFLEDQYGKIQVERALAGKDNTIQFSAVYKPTINAYGGEENLQFEITRFQ